MVSLRTLFGRAAPSLVTPSVAVPLDASPPPNLPPVRARRTSQKRQRTHTIAVHVTPEEYAALTAKAAEAGLSAGGFLRACGFGAPTPRTTRQATPHRVLWAEGIAALNRVGNNLNQIARSLHRGGMVTPAEITTALQGYGEAVTVLMRAIPGAGRDH